MTVTSDALKAVSDEIREIQKRARKTRKPSVSISGPNSFKAQLKRDGVRLKDIRR